MKKANPNNNKIPCLICEKQIEILFFPGSTLSDIAKGAFDRAVECSSPGNFGSQVFDLDGMLHFVICDRCIIANSHKMLLKQDRSIPMQNAREYYEEWWSRLREESPYPAGEDPYFEGIKDYFDDF